jgi:mannose-1-phosphate guanylyltransferase
MGTAGPIRLAKDLILNENPSGLLFVFNSDVICHYPLEKMVEFHKSNGGEGTIMVTEVEDPTKYGVVVADASHKVERFVEKPSVFISNKINVGLYLFNVSIIDRIENRPTSIEREIFPKMAESTLLGQIQTSKPRIVTVRRTHLPNSDDVLVPVDAGEYRLPG